MKVPRFSGICFGLFVIVLLSLDCGGGSGGGGASNGSPKDCDLLGAFRITDAPSWACDDFPAVGETVTVANAGDGTVLRAGTMELPMAASPEMGACTFVAHGCHSVPAVNGQGGRYLDVQFTISKTATGIRLVSQTTDVDDGSPGACQTPAGTTESYEAVPLSGCQPAGTYTAASAAILKSGSCQIAWQAGDVGITSAADGKFDLDWAGTDVEGLTLDKSACTLRGSKGISSGTSFDIWSWNGAERHLQIQLQITPSGLIGEAEDALDGATSDGLSCSGGTYSLQASASAARPVVALDSTCSTSPPSVCGDGVCDPGESCRGCTADCVCKAGATCAPDGVCRHVCSLPTESTDCASGERCSPDNPSYPTVIQPFDTLHCVPEGNARAGEACSETNSCRAGLVCHVPVRGTRYTCAAPCGQDFPSCPAGRTCGEQGDGSGVGSYPTAVMACE